MKGKKHDPRTSPKTGDVLGHRWASKFPNWRRMLGCDARTQIICYLDPNGRRGHTTRSEWCEWAAEATPPPTDFEFPDTTKDY